MSLPPGKRRSAVNARRGRRMPASIEKARLERKLKLGGAVGSGVVSFGFAQFEK